MANDLHLHPVDLTTTVVVPTELWVPGTVRPAAEGPARPPLWLHRAGPTDVDDLHDLYERLSPEARRNRFFSPTPRVSRSVARYLCNADPSDHLAWLARTGGRDGPVVAEVQAARDDRHPASAELALAVDDPLAGRGIGRLLMSLLHDLAGHHDIDTFTAEALADNRACVGLLHSFGMTGVLASGVLTWTGAVRPSRSIWWTSAAEDARTVPTLGRSA